MVHYKLKEERDFGWVGKFLFIDTEEDKIWINGDVIESIRFDKKKIILIVNYRF